MKKTFELEIVLLQLADGIPAAIEELYYFYYPRLYNFSKKILKLEDGIDDILQEVFIKIWQNKQNIRTSATFNAFIFTITRNLLLNELRSRLNNQKIKEKVGKLAIAVEYSFFEQTEYHDLKEKVDLAINELPIRQKEIFILSRIDGFSHKEIAEKLAINSKTVEYHIAKAIILLKRKLVNFELVSILFFFCSY
ncbi:MAG: RNA polymerase sigma-70 factor [Prolixibacteraceae bacterium]